jgi:two-component system KDP operon response regulator KdpE
MTGGEADVISILVIDDEPQIRRVIHDAFVSTPFVPYTDDHAVAVRVIEARSGRDGVHRAVSEIPVLVILDLGLPDMPGIDVCREIRQSSSVPIIVVSARHAEREKVALLDAGADDYMTKPFSMAELLARSRAQLRRTRASMSSGDPTELQLGDVRIDLPRRRVERDGVLVHLTPTEWALLRAFVMHPGRTLTHRHLFQLVWSNSEGDAQQYLRVYVGHLRRKIESDPTRPRFLQTEPGVGYRFQPDAELQA